MADEEIDLDAPTYHAVPPPADGDAPGPSEPAEAAPAPEPARKKSPAELRLDAIRKKLVRARRGAAVRSASLPAKGQPLAA